MFGRKKKGDDPLNWRVPVRSVAQPAPEESASVVATRVLERVEEMLGERCLFSHSWRGDETVEVAPEHLHELVRFLREDAELRFDFLTDLTAVDGLGLGWEPRFKVVYHLYSTTRNHRLRVRVPVGGGSPEAPSLTSYWGVADWFEREVWDMYGIRFEGHPDLRRILMYEEFEGHPLRKDYPYRKRQPLIGPNPQRNPWREGKWPRGVGKGSGEGPKGAPGTRTDEA
jgi:NADH-quinone oxidoreductase subunit C